LVALVHVPWARLTSGCRLVCGRGAGSVRGDTELAAAIEPVIRESLSRISDQLPGQPEAIGGYWTRTNDPEVDLIGADREPVAQRIAFVGAIKWRDNHPFDERDLAALIAHRSQVPGATEDTPLIAVARSGVSVRSPVALGPDDLLAAW
jgi:uncharacterized protein